jgi:beta-galactosidase
VALKLTAISAPGGLRADGSDVALFDVEAVDARGERCPTVEARVDFTVGGPGVWRGGYNSGKLNSTNNTYLDLEAGIARVSVRATRAPGVVTVRATSAGLTPAFARVASVAFAAENGMAAVMPAVPPATLPAASPSGARVFPVTGAALAGGGTGPGAAANARGMVGRFTKAFNYSGPSSYLVHVETQARNGKNVYVDIDGPFAALPAELDGADWVQAANRENLYNAVDLMEVSVVAGATVSIAHDDRLPRPAWLTRQFQPTALTLTMGGRAMTVFSRRVERDESLTLGANTEAQAPAANMYVVFVNK